jgi:hypothetical protein
MGNLVAGIKRFFSNKNTVTILGVLVAVVVLWAFYNYRLNKAVTPIKVPVAKERIGATTEITAEMIEYTEVSNQFVASHGVITDSAALIGKVITTGTSIPAGGMFYTEQVVEKKSLPNSVFDEIPKGYAIFSLPVDAHSTYANSIYPGTRIDLYLSTQDETGKEIYDPFITSIEVGRVRDGSGQDVFDQNPPGMPSELIFVVPNDMYQILYIAVNNLGLRIVPVPRNKEYTSDAAETKFASQTLKDMVEARIAQITDIVMPSEESDTEEIEETD